jgi:hypothetical protein
MPPQLRDTSAGAVSNAHVQAAGTASCAELLHSWLGARSICWTQHAVGGYLRVPNLLRSHQASTIIYS